LARLPKGESTRGNEALDRQFPSDAVLAESGRQAAVEGLKRLLREMHEVLEDLETATGQGQALSVQSLVDRVEEGSSGLDQEE
jgi:hypothetical protein